MHPIVLLLSGLAAAVLVVGCRPEDGPPAVSIDQARRTTAEMRQAGFAPPPRSVDDIVAMLARERPDPARGGALRARADAIIAEGGEPATRVRQLQDRAQAASDLGRVAQARRDATAALALVREHRLDGFVQLAFLRSLEATAGNVSDSIRHAEAVIESAGTLAGRRFIALGGSANNLAETGDLEHARIYLARTETLWSESQRWPDPDGNRDAWRTGLAMARGGVALATGRSDTAIAEFREGVDAYSRFLRSAAVRGAGGPIGRGETAVQLFRAMAAAALAQAGRLPEAEVESRRALSDVVAVVGRDHPDTAIILHSTVRILLDQGRSSDAERLAREAIAIQDRVGIEPGSWRAVRSRLLLAESLQAQERHTDALDVLRDVESAAASDPDTLRRALANDPALGFSLLRTGRAREAAGVLEPLAARRAVDYGAGHVQTALARGLHAAALHRVGERAQARAGFAAAVPVLLESGREAGREGSAVRTRMATAVLESYIDLLADTGTPAAVEEAFRIADAARGRAVQNALGASAARAAIADPQLADLARREQDAEVQVAALYGVLNSLLTAPPAQRDEGIVARVRSQIGELRGARVALRGEIEARFPGYAELVDARPATIAQARAALAPNEALVAMFVGRERSYVWGVRRAGDVAFARVPMDATAVAASVQALRRALDPVVARIGDIPAFDVAVAHDLYARFVEPLGAALDGAATIAVVPHGALAQLPLGVLVTAPTGRIPGGDGRSLFDGYKAVPFLIRQHAVAQLPSVAAFVSLRAAPPGPVERRPFVGFGDPVFDAGAPPRSPLVAAAGASTRGIAMERRNLPQLAQRASAGLAQLPALPDTGEELREVARALGADPVHDVFVGAAASEQRVKSMPLADRRTVMFATHGLVPGDLDGLTQPALALSAPGAADGEGDGLLTLDEILSLRLAADWVVLSACNTAAGDGAGAEALSGLGRAFFYAGARAVLASNWPVETASARMLTTDLFRRQAAEPGVPRAEALRRAMLALLDGPGALQGGRAVFSYAHPIFWAPFTVVGDGGPSSR
ncbi:MAG: CHAT domain-containing protein [Alphaproteobacteria bacterium]|nr:CHAT domain-containing protein [Alphaproteobacteria bacterium]